MTWVLLVVVVILCVVVVANAVTIAKNTAMIAQYEEDIHQLKNESAYLHNQLALRRRARGTAQNPGRSIDELERRAGEITRKLNGGE